MAVDMFLKLGDVLGESKDKVHKDEIEILSFQWGAQQTGTIGSSGGGAGAGKVQLSELTFTDRVQKSSPLLFRAVATGEHIKEAVITVRKAGQTNDFYKLSFQDVFLTSVQHSASEGGEEDTPFESAGFAYAKVSFEYRQQLPGGSFSEWIKSSWDQTENKE